jgi:hypothetical protein
MGQHPGDLRCSEHSIPRGCRVLRPPRRDVMGQHRRVNTGIYQLLAKKSQSPFPRNDLRALQNQGSGRAAPSLWDGCDLNPDRHEPAFRKSGDWLCWSDSCSSVTPLPDRRVGSRADGKNSRYNQTVHNAHRKILQGISFRPMVAS